MKKIALFAAVFLMTSVGYGQVDWGKFEKLIPRNARTLVELTVEREASNCFQMADKSVLSIVSVNMIDPGEGEVIMSVNADASTLNLSVEAIPSGLSSDGFMQGQVHCEFKKQ